MVATARKALDRLTGRPAEPTSIRDRWTRLYIERAETATQAAENDARRARYRLAVETKSELLLAEIIAMDPNDLAEHKAGARALLIDEAADLVAVTDAEEAELWKMTALDEPSVVITEPSTHPWQLESVRTSHVVTTRTWARGVLGKLDDVRRQRQQNAAAAAARVVATPAMVAAVDQAKAALEASGDWHTLTAGSAVARAWFNGPDFYRWAKDYAHSVSPAVLHRRLTELLAAERGQDGKR